MVTAVLLNGPHHMVDLQKGSHHMVDLQKGPHLMVDLQKGPHLTEVLLIANPLDPMVIKEEIFSVECMRNKVMMKLQLE